MRMRLRCPSTSRTLLSALAIAVLISWPSGQPARGAGVFGAAGQFAYAEWTTTTRREERSVFVAVERFLDHSGTFGTRGHVGVISCVEKPRKGNQRDSATVGIVVRCRGRIRSYPLPLDAFEMDPLLESAHVSIPTRRSVHRVTWESTGSPYPEHWFFDWGAGAEAGGGIASDARAGGRILGERLSSAPARGHDTDAYLFEGGGSFVEYPVAPAGQQITLQKRAQVPDRADSGQLQLAEHLRRQILAEVLRVPTSRP